jgi:hypothetical protein
MMLPPHRRLLPLLLWFLGSTWLASAAPSPSEWLKHEASAGDFVLASPAGAPALYHAPEDHAVVAIAVLDLATDIERVSGQRPRVGTSAPAGPGPVVAVGTLGQSPLIDSLVSAGKLDVSALRGAWESFTISTVEHPWPDVPRALVIVGSDRRGTAYGVYELAQAIGVSPWHWWADVPPQKRPTLAIAAGARRYGPPSVQYRGIFINDEDWALQPWAAHTFEPENGDIGPRTYQKIFELLLRLKANTLWPAMHPSTKPFNAFPENAPLADRYAIVMGSSHAEPMLRNNVGEWKHPAEDYNYVTNRDGVRRYWEERVERNGRFEAIYTVGMRGIHDSRMHGPRDDAERIATLQQVFQDQRDMIARHVNREAERVPQMFCAYKEVLDLYRQGLAVPDDVTIVWPDDNFGYIRNFTDPAGTHRSGGYGVYYHISYLGRPLAYLWLNTVPPALIWQEMVKAYEHGADRMWIVNVGDLKPGEIGTEFFLQLAWDVNRWDEAAQPRFLLEWAGREFGAKHAGAIADVMSEYYTLNFQRKPEHLQWWLPGEAPRWSPLTPAEVQERLTRFDRLVDQVRALDRELSNHQAAFFQLVSYPVEAAAAANRRYFHAEQYARNFDHHLALARRHGASAHQAEDQLIELTRRFNEDVAAGKWRHFMTLEPADPLWRSMRIAPLPLPARSMFLQVSPAATADIRFDRSGNTGFSVSLPADRFVSAQARGEATWTVVPGLGRSGRAVTIRPSTAGSHPADDASASSFLEYEVTLPTGGDYVLEVQFLPTHPLETGQPLRVAIATAYDRKPRVVASRVVDGSPEWARGVLDGVLRAHLPLHFTDAGTHRIRLHHVDSGVVVDRLILSQGELRPSYFGPQPPR